MKIDDRLAPVVREIRSGADTDPDWNVTDEIKRNTDKYRLTDEEVRYLCRRFGVLTEDVK